MINLQVEAAAFPTVPEGYEPTTEIINSTYSDIIVLPATAGRLLHFDARLEGDNVYLDWEIEGDINTSSFIVERKTPDSEFLAIGGVKEFGERANFRRYTFKDEWELETNVRRQYRLKQKFEDGTFIYHDPITILSVPALSLEAFPSPVNNQLSLNLPETENRSYTVSFFNVSGTLLDKVEIKANSFGTKLQTFDMSRFSAGMLWVRVQSGHQSWEHKIIKN
ncbi:MAG: T9SS type A sorting domain-containing protein [Bacteroidia bacterium]|nr:T9SS type A sorting domain-containing protein [Bacteroidia bacterium]